MNRFSLAARTSMAAAAATIFALAIVAVVMSATIHRVLLDRVNQQLRARAGSAAILAAVGERLSVSELSQVAGAARIVYDASSSVSVSTATHELHVGDLPMNALPAIVKPGWSTAQADGEKWRLLTVEVRDVPVVGDRALVQLVAPLGDVDDQSRVLRRRFTFFGGLFVIGSGVLGYLFGLLAVKPLRRLRDDAAGLRSEPTQSLRVGTQYGAVEVDELALVLNQGFERIGEETKRRHAALETARAFSASAAHELRTPLTSALTNLDVARSDAASRDSKEISVVEAHTQLQRMASTLTALRNLAEADLAESTWFIEFDLADVVGVIVDEEQRRNPEVHISLHAPESLMFIGWADGLRIAVSNVLRNAIKHAQPPDAMSQTITVSLWRESDLVKISVVDNGPGLPTQNRERLLERFQRGSTHADGSGLGLSLTNQVARLHGGSVLLGDAPSGGANVTINLSA